ncbi:uncharacterized protein BYT42DRAFT_589776 [Radiomyces spectabilis]|uniref:uncharacterized protein n=1 Tax=Radiomyces spectabilis TaxID=64574 RepID=UPI00221F8869|nr:uncharacterized protein BYT42DRAFT_589776 [Radiomyces spectabilis]KAI8365406.1 hypothetical protein BYT42DRAFT_589776 [Radiomyces spectabilis]
MAGRIFLIKSAIFFSISIISDHFFTIVHIFSHLTSVLLILISITSWKHLENHPCLWLNPLLVFITASTRAGILSIYLRQVSTEKVSHSTSMRSHNSWTPLAWRS